MADEEERPQLIQYTSANGEAGAEVALSPKSLVDQREKLSSVGSKASGAGSGKHEKRSHSGKRGCPKKGGGGGKGTWGVWPKDGKDVHVDHRDPNYDSEEEPYKLVGAPVALSLQEYSQMVVLVVEEYFTNGNIAETACNLQDLGAPNYLHYFVKKLISMALDRHDREKEMASVLLSALYVVVINKEQLAKGFTRLLESVDGLSLDIPDAAELLALFLARAVVDDILPPAFLSKTQKLLPEGSQGIDVIQSCQKSYLLAPLDSEAVERRWGGSMHTTIEQAKIKIKELLIEYVESGDKVEACRRIRELNVPFFHHEVVKKAVTLAMEKKSAQGLIVSLLGECAEEGLITSSQMSKGFARLSESLDDLTLDIPNAKNMLEEISLEASKDGWLTSFKRTFSADSKHISKFKKQATSIIQEYFLSGDIAEVIRSLEDLAVPDYHDIFVKKLIMLAMDRKNHEKEMASVLVSSLYSETVSIAQIVKAFALLLEAAEDTALDILDAPNELALFLARAVVDDVLAPLYLEEIDEQLKEGSLGREIVHTAQSILSARHAGERVLRCWGGGTGSVFDDARDRIVKLLEEFEAGGVLNEACQCIRDLDMPFFHHEVVKKSLIMAMEKKNDRLLSLLQEGSNEGLITTSQMQKGFMRILDVLDDLALDIPDAKEKFELYVQQAKTAGWLTSVTFQNGVSL